MAVLEPLNVFNSAYKPIVYTRTFIDVPFTGISILSSSLYPFDAIMLLMTTANAAFFVANQRLYIASGIYAGNYTVLASTSTGVHIRSENLGSASGTAKPLNSETVKVYAGYDSSHPAHLVYPYQKIAEYTAVPNLTGTTSIDISPYLQAAFDKYSGPVEGRDYELLIPFDVVLAGYTSVGQLQRYCMNSTVEHSALEQRAIPFSGAAAMQIDEPIHFVDGVVIYSMITYSADIGFYPINVFGLNGQGYIGGLGFDQIGSTFIIE